MSEQVFNALAARTQAAYGKLATTTQAAVEDLFLQVGGPSQSDFLRWADRHVSMVTGAANQAAGLGDAYMRAFFTADGLETVATAAPDLAAITATIERHAVSVRKRLLATLSEGSTEEAALSTAARYASWLTVGDLQTAQQRGGVSGASAKGVTVKRWRKVPSSDACRWCLQVALNPYYSIDTIARHATCKCGYAPVQWTTQRYGSQLRYASRKEFNAAASDPSTTP